MASDLRYGATNCKTAFLFVQVGLAGCDMGACTHGVTKKCLHQEWNVSIEQALEIEAEAQAIRMQTEDFRRAFQAFAAKERPVFEGN